LEPNKQIKTADIKDIIDIFKHTKMPRFAPRLNSKKGINFCYVCGHNDGFKFIKVLNDDLTNEWTLNKKLKRAFDIRESMVCMNCGTALRSNIHARAICAIVAPGARYLEEAVNLNKVRRLKIAEINACGNIHKTLNKLPHLVYSEYKPKDKKVNHEDLHNLSYRTSSLDIVLTSETMEHIPNWQKAKKEIFRVLKPGGKHIFTAPVILTRKTRVRSLEKDGKEIKLLPDSFHGCTRGVRSSDYIVRTEFGADFRREIDELGFSTDLYYRNILHLYDPVFVFVSTKL
jgi:SAM-dependent methyltransferase